MMKSVVVVLSLICGIAHAQTSEMPIELFNHEALLKTILELKDVTYSVVRIENHSSSSEHGVSLQVFHFVPASDEYVDCTLRTRTDEHAPIGSRVAIVENECPLKAE